MRGEWKVLREIYQENTVPEREICVLDMKSKNNYNSRQNISGWLCLPRHTHTHTHTIKWPWDKSNLGDLSANSNPCKCITNMHAKSLSRTVKDLRFYPICKLTIQPATFMDVDLRHKAPGSEIQNDFLITAKALAHVVPVP